MSDGKLDALKNTAIFASCTKKQLNEIGKITDRVNVPAGRTLVKEGSIPTQMTILVSGKAEVESGGQILAELGAGDVVGELALVDDEPASATVTVTDDAEVWLIATSGFKPVWDKNPDISTALLHAVVGRLRATNELLA